MLNVLNATELLNNKCGNGNWKPGAALDFNQIVKRINRSLKAVALIMPDMFMESKMIIYELTFIFHRLYGCLHLEPLGLGLYASYDSAQQAIQHYITQPGFRDCPEAFSIRQREIKGFVKNSEFFEAQVYFHTDDYDYEYSIELGLFADKAAADEAMSTYVQENTALFNVPDLVVEKIVNRCIIDKREWLEGFVIS